MSPALRLVLLALPLTGLGWVWYDTARSSAQGTEWDVPVGGYDPRDLLKGHYIQYSYQWPAGPTVGKSEDLPPEDLMSGPATRLCLQGQAPTITRAIRLTDTTPAIGCAAIIHEPAPIGASTIARAGRLYVSEAVATRMQSALSDSKQQATLHFRLRPDGIIVPISLSFQPKP